MADHKTKRTGHDVPLPDPDIVERSIAAAIDKVKARRGYYVTIAVLLLAAIVAAFTLIQLPSNDAPSEFNRLWTRAQAVRNQLDRDRSAREELALLEGLLTELRDTPQEGIALWLLGIYHYAEANTSDKVSFEQRRPHFEKAIGFLEELGEKRFDELLLAKPQWFTSDRQAPIGLLLARVKADLKWGQEHARKAPLPDDDVVAVLRTSEGDIHWKFFQKLAPKHFNNFVTLATLGTYNGTKFHFVRGGNEDPISVMGGDPFTFFYPKALTKTHILRWGRGGVGYDLPPEDARFKVVHQRGTVTSQRVERADWDNGAQFQIMLKPDRSLDRIHTPFATVVEGMNVVEKIAARKTASADETYKDDNDFASVFTGDLLVEPVEIYKVIIYRDGKAMEHHFPLSEAEKTLGTVSGTPATEIPEKMIYGGRRLRSVDAEGEIKRGLEFPFPDDLDTSPDAKEKPNPKGDREGK